MQDLIVVYSMTGNNRLLARHIANRAGTEVREVVPRSRRGKVTILIDMVLRRRPRVVPVAGSDERFGRVLFVFPVWNSRIAYPMASAMRGLAGRFEEYGLASLCGAKRPGQAEALCGEAAGLLGARPGLAEQLPVARLTGGRGMKDSDYRVSAAELAEYRPQLDRIRAWLSRVDAEPA